MKPMRPLLERFWDKVLVNPSGCWTWTGALSCGYGVIGVGRRGEGVILAHRVMVEFARGPIPDGYQVDHLCRNRACVNPSHLEAVTQHENLRRQAAALAAARTTCRRGHPYTPENTRVTERQRVCRVCVRMATWSMDRRKDVAA